VAVRLQHAVLPLALPALEGCDVAAHYAPSGRTGVGGDFYDVLSLADGRLAVFVGDVMGRGVEAAASMAQMRAAVRAYVAVDPQPEAVLTKLDTMMAAYGEDQLVTLVYLLVDPARDELVVANAGHPAPTLLRADGSVEHFQGADAGPLGTAGGPRHHDRVVFCPGDTVLLFTDGLIERRTEDIDAGRERLGGAVGLLAERDLQRALADLVQQVRDATQDDDVAAVALRRHPLPATGRTPSEV
jgi:serine phosphatase RsbU (regulator of sigma subunit)